MVNKEPACQCRRQRHLGWIPGQEDPLERAWQATPVFLPGEARGQRTVAGSSAQGCKESTVTEAT